jgi:ribose transport system ATP-binding protein
MTETLLEVQNICKFFPGVQALRDVSLDIQPGEVHIILGENGAGKSTLIKILCGVYQPDSGIIHFKGKPISFNDPGDAREAGIRVIYQEPSLVPSITVAENIYLGSEPGYAEFLPVIDEKRMMSGTLELMDRLNLMLDPFSLVSDLSLAERQMVAIARALHLAADLVIMDEPTSMFSQHEVSQLFSVIRRLRAHGIGILYVTHRLEEAMQIGDRATILQDGRKMATLTIDDTTRSDLISMIVGQHIDDRLVRSPIEPGPEILRVEKLSAKSGLQNVSFDLRAGEILGFTGLVGAGGTGLLRAIFGADPISGGAIFLDGQRVTVSSPQDAISHGIGLLTEDRQEQGLVLEMIAQQNVTLASLEEIGRGPIIDQEVESSIARHYANRLNVHTSDLDRKTLFLSGGTQQKLVLSRWLASRCRVLLLDEPTRGVDVGARVEFYRLLNELSRRGLGIIIVSSNLSEILNLSDRIAVLRHGQIITILPRAAASPAEILSLVNGGTAL